MIVFKIYIGQLRQRRISLEADPEKARNAGGETEQGGAGAGAAFQHVLARFRPDRGCEQHRLESGTVAIATLLVSDVAAEKRARCELSHAARLDPFFRPPDMMRELTPPGNLGRDKLDGATPVTTDALTRLTILLETELHATNRAIVARMDSPVALIPQLAAHLVASGGKRLRPLLTLAAAKLCGYEGERHVSLAACVEFIHTATLLHDDVVDESVLRRGSASANAVFGNKASVLVGDFLFARAFQLMVDDGSLEVLRILSAAAATIAEGEVLQLTTQNDLETTEQKYFDVIRGKTAALFAAACEVGGVIAGRSAAECAALQSFGMELGMAFQLVDDALDYDADQTLLGKTVGDDFREGKLTYPVLLAIASAAAEGDEAAFWTRTIGRGEQTATDLQTALDFMRKHNATGHSLARADEFVASACATLEIFPDSPMRQALMDVARYTTARRF
jgi:octaprenyl-diphosphate synthase